MWAAVVASAALLTPMSLRSAYRASMPLLEPRDKVHFRVLKPDGAFAFTHDGDVAILFYKNTNTRYDKLEVIKLVSTSRDPRFWTECRTAYFADPERNVFLSEKDASRFYSFCLD